MKGILIYLIKQVWQARFSQTFANRYNCICRFYPSCSEYAVLALRRYGLIQALRKSYCRLRRCVPRNTDSCIDFP
ncbi:MAG: membrane protein insertion efficiency factor YidD [Acidobacteria bacterium]|nr:membrane protein insertion efficiency factor YidD [Acidobacteriota bacterium]